MAVTPYHRQGWRLVQIAELLRRSQRAHAEALECLGALDAAALPEHSIARYDGPRVERLGEAIGDLGVQIQLLTNDLPSDVGGVSAADVAAVAASDLAAGIFDEARLLLAARVLSVEVGWPALAEALRSTDAREGWEETTVTRLLGSFRDAAPQDVARVLASARLPADEGLATCATEPLLRLADALEHHSLR